MHYVEFTAAVQAAAKADGGIVAYALTFTGNDGTTQTVTWSVEKDEVIGPPPSLELP